MSPASGPAAHTPPALLEPVFQPGRSKRLGEWQCQEKPATLPVFYTASTATAHGLPRSAGQVTGSRRSVVSGVFVHPTQQSVGAVPEWADAGWLEARNLVAALQVRRPDMVLSHVTAARFYGLPVPNTLEAGSISVTPESSYTRLPAPFRCHRPRPVDTWHLYGVSVASPGQVVRQIASAMSEDGLVEVLDALCGPWKSEPYTTPEELQRRALEWRRFHGRSTLVRSLAHVRAHVGSPQETRLRLTIVRAGLPEPSVSHPVVVGGRLFHPDLSYPALKIAIEYEGRHHLTDERQWHHDIMRERELTRMGWIYLRVTAADSAADVIEMVTHALGQRGIRAPGW